ARPARGCGAPPRPGRGRRPDHRGSSARGGDARALRPPRGQGGRRAMISSLRGDLVHALRAYPTLLRVGLAEAVAYRAEMIVWLIHFFTMALIGSVAFFLESSTAVFELWMAAFMILSGYLIPLDLFPPGIRAVTHALPFRYTLAFPVEIITGTLRGAALYRAL